MQHPYRAPGPLPRLSWWARHGSTVRQAAYALGATVSLAYAVTGSLAGCDKQGHLQAPVAATIAQVNTAACPILMPVAATAAAGAVALAGSGPLAALVAEVVATSFTCQAEEKAVAALLAELTATPPAVDAGAGVGVASAAITASRPGLVPITRRDGSVVLLAPASVAPACQAAQARLDARAQ